MSATDKAKLDRRGYNEATECATNRITNLLNISTTTPTASNMDLAHFGTEDTSTLSNCPISSGAFYGIRRCYWTSADAGIGTSHAKVIVELLEAYPIPGRTWSNVYNTDSSSWSGWKDYYPS